MKQLTVYSTPNCSHCEQAKEYLTDRAIPFIMVNLQEDTEAMNFVRSQGHRSVPQIYLEGQQLVNGWPALRELSAAQILEKING
jgi:glutaredoxin-like protein NrdH